MRKNKIEEEAPSMEVVSGEESPESEGPLEVREEDSEGPADEAAPPIPLTEVLEAILFASQKPVSSKEVRQILKGAAEAPASVAFGKTKEAEIREVFSELAIKLQERGATYEVRETAAGWQLVTRPDFAPWLRQMFPENRPARMSAPALETLAIIAYRQPITRADIEAVRGVAVDGVMQTLLDRGLVKIGGRAEIPGRPLLYETTQFFMEHFGLRDLDELPNAGELRKIELPTAPVPEAAETTPELFPPAAATEEGSVGTKEIEPATEPTTEPATEPPPHG